ncbi:hypothetical protein [Thalassococcus lentus]|uniref:SH3 domain-containing protein n=1 Tax=Thalassococcus lentus TaxID=1210524 RepID=A0ABT4XUG2_9RHOB|nr:hypothetical protein [Thalassococcus lentus]MDA7425616.1 hypothetical protein [Thalassococcus lentus]
MRLILSCLPPPGLICVALAWFASEKVPGFGKDLQSNATPNPPPRMTEAAPQREDVAPYVVAKAHDYSDEIAMLASRPLFSPTRRNPEPVAIEDPEPEISKVVVAKLSPPTAPVAAVAPEQPELEYRGLIGSDGKRSALLHDKSNSTEFWVVVSDGVSDWIVAEITTSYVRFTHGIHEFIVEFRQ